MRAGGAIDERPWERRRRGDGSALIRLSWAGTVTSCVASVVNAVTGDRNSYALSAGPGLVMFAVGSGVVLVAFALAVERSRQEAIGIGGLYFLAGSAPRSVQISLLASLVVQSTVPLAVALVRPFTAFGVLAPMWALGLAGLWGARHGRFPARADASPTGPPDDRRTTRSPDATDSAQDEAGKGGDTDG